MKVRDWQLIANCCPVNQAMIGCVGSVLSGGPPTYGAMPCSFILSLGIILWSHWKLVQRVHDGVFSHFACRTVSCP